MQLINEEIKNSQVRIVGEGYNDVGIVFLEDALEMAEKENLDLVQVSEKDGVPVCKIMNYSKYVYEQNKSKKNQKKGQKKSEVKEIRVGCNIADHDLLIKAKKANNILDDGDKVKVSVLFKGRQIAFANTQGPTIIGKFLNEMPNINIIKPQKLEGNAYTIYLERKNIK